MSVNIFEKIIKIISIVVNALSIAIRAFTGTSIDDDVDSD